MAAEFLEDERLTKLVTRARNLQKQQKVFSDVVDDKGNQYVDLVQEGGGVLGIGLVGYAYILEQAGIRFYSLAGTSAGAISTLLVACMGKIGEPVSMKILEILSQKNLFDFVDGPKGIKNLIQKKIEGKSGLFWNVLWNSCSIYYSIKNKFGLNPGKTIEEWFFTKLKEENITTLSALQKHRTDLPKLKNRLDKKLPVSEPRLAIITSEITTHTKVDFPRMASLYWENVEEISPAEFVRASISIPAFYYPYNKSNIPFAGKKATNNWQEMAGYYGKIPPEVKFVDGGLLSNFPINIFHRAYVPSRPTFGVRLSTYRQNYSKTQSFFSYTWAIVNTMRQIHDYDFIHQNPDYKQLICHIDADEEFNWLNFDMKKERQKELFLLGAEKGIEFLEKFDWEAYKKTREKTLA
ncbi:patatin-like phospholipase family protein [Mesonia aquimarina]|uniref:patatin-like phospholipase family protein n=1 Tax=Mesonia aquimarina TaxID=1504967 RepID=UPI000EF57D70|nr:patatin-like phospholipase family protein [Mesonia aquimarina]